jgi:hypothetical protein
MQARLIKAKTLQQQLALSNTQTVIRILRMALMSFGANEFEKSRQFLLDRQCERNHPKRHRTLKRARAKSAAKKAKHKHERIVRENSYREHVKQVRLYWQGLADHP